MTRHHLARRRLHVQRLHGAPFPTASDAVASLVAVQSQDHGGARWGVAQRVRDPDGAAFDRAFDAGEILRTHILRPTWHFVAPADLRWLQELTSPRLRPLLDREGARQGLDAAAFRRSRTVLEKALLGSRFQTRDELADRLSAAGFEAMTGLRLQHVVMRAEFDAVICSGPIRGKQHTYALVEERTPKTPRLDRDEALARLAGRYFRSRGPATVKDFAWWSGLTNTDAGAGLDAVRHELESVDVEGATYWSAPNLGTPGPTKTAWFLPNYDEFLIAYTDRTASLKEPPADKLDARGAAFAHNLIVVDGQVVGRWSRTLKKATVELDVTLFDAIPAASRRAIEAAADRYGAFLGVSPVLRIA